MKLELYYFKWLWLQSVTTQKHVCGSRNYIWATDIKKPILKEFWSYTLENI